MTEQLDLFQLHAADSSQPTAGNEPVDAACIVDQPDEVTVDFRLASLPLLGRGTAQVESVKSYVMRLADAHSYRTTDMVKLIGRNSVLRNQAPKDWLGKFYDTAFSDASVASDWIPAIASRNGVTHLEEGLACSWGSLLGKNRGSGTWTTRWCAHCLEESHREGGAFLPAAWSVGLVTACSVHGTVLETACHHCGAGQTPSGRGTRRFAMHAPGVCGTCGEWLGTCDPRTPEEGPRQISSASEREMDMSIQIGSLLARPMAPSESFGVHRVLEVARDRYFGGSMARLSEWIGLNKSTVHGWLAGDVLPEVGRLVTLAGKLGILLRELVVGDVDSLPKTLQKSEAGLTANFRSAPRGHEKRAALQAMFAEKPNLPVREAARQLGMSHRDVYYHLGQEVHTHSDLRRDVHGRVREERRGEAEAAVLDKLMEIYVDGSGVTVRELRAAVATRLPNFSYSQQQETVHRVWDALAA